MCDMRDRTCLNLSDRFGIPARLLAPIKPRDGGGYVIPPVGADLIVNERAAATAMRQTARNR